MRAKPFSRPTLIAAVELLEGHSQARCNQMVLRLGLEDEIGSGTAVSVAKKCDILGRIVVQRSDQVLDTLDGTMTLGEAVVREAVQLLRAEPSLPRELALGRGLARDVYVVSFGDYGRDPTLRAALPDEVQLPETDDEVHQLLKSFQFTTPLGHLDQAVEAHTRGDWAACNSQLRTFLESLFDDIARNVRPQDAAQRPVPRTGARSWPIRVSAFLRSTGTNGRPTARTTSTASSRCCTPRARTLGCRTRITAPFACMSSSSRPVQKPSPTMSHRRWFRAGYYPP
jgi:hypothetical protein